MKILFLIGATSRIRNFHDALTLLADGAVRPLSQPAMRERSTATRQRASSLVSSRLVDSHRYASA